MEKENIYLNLGENKVSVKQTSNGFWYVNELSVSCLSIMDGLALMDRAVTEAEKILQTHNATTDKLPQEKKPRQRKTTEKDFTEKLIDEPKEKTEKENVKTKRNKNLFQTSPEK